MERMTMSKKIAVFTSGGDAPGMNAAIRAAVRVAIASGVEVYGIQRGLQGMIEDDIIPMDARSVSNIIQRGGTILHTARSKDFMQVEGQKQAAKNLEARGISGILGIGGDGTFHGLVELEKFWKGQIIGLPGTIDNDLFGSDFTIGFDTAINTALDAIDKLRDTADAHERVFLVEVMGRWAGYIALDVAIAGGAEQVLLPDGDEDEIIKVAKEVELEKRRGKISGILVVSERGKEGSVYELARKLEEHTSYKFKETILGHIQRGGSPTARDRVLATKLGAFGVKMLSDERISGVMAGEIAGNLTLTPLKETWTRKKDKPLDPFLIEIIDALAI